MSDNGRQDARTNCVQAPPFDLTVEELNLYQDLFFYRKVQKLTFRQIQETYYPGASLPVISRASRKVMPKQDKARASLGLPVMRPAPVCPRCGDVHTTKRCTGTPRKPRNRRAVNLDDPASAAATIAAHSDDFYRNELIQHLLKTIGE